MAPSPGRAACLTLLSYRRSNAVGYDGTPFAGFKQTSVSRSATKGADNGINFHEAAWPFQHEFHKISRDAVYSRFTGFRYLISTDHFTPEASAPRYRHARIEQISIGAGIGRPGFRYSAQRRSIRATPYCSVISACRPIFDVGGMRRSSRFAFSLSISRGRPTSG